MAISAKDVMALRKRTGLGMMECKQALGDADGDAEEAIKLLKERLGSKMAERSDREAGEGAISWAKGDGVVALIELASETDFAARNDSFIEAAEKIAQMALNAPDGVSQGTPEMQELVDNLRITIKENISLRKVIKLSGENVGGYVHHTRKAGAIVAAEGGVPDDLLSGICQHITATIPPATPALAVASVNVPFALFKNSRLVPKSPATAISTCPSPSRSENLGENPKVKSGLPAAFGYWSIATPAATVVSVNWPGFDAPALR